MYYQAASVKQSDAFVVICTITSTPSNPAPVPTTPRYLVSKDFLDSIGSLLDE